MAKELLDPTQGRNYHEAPLALASMLFLTNNAVACMHALTKLEVIKYQGMLCPCLLCSYGPVTKWFLKRGGLWMQVATSFTVLVITVVA